MTVNFCLLHKINTFDFTEISRKEKFNIIIKKEGT